MKIIWIMLLLCCIASIPLSAQDNYPRVEIYGGFQMMSNEDINVDNTRIIDIGFGEGFTAAGEFNIKSFFSFVTEIERQTVTKRQNITSPNGTLTIKGNQSVFLVGPRFGYRNSRIRLFGHILVGYSRAKGDISNSATQGSGTIEVNDFAIVPGGGLDISLGHWISLRPSQFEVLIAGSDHADGSFSSQWCYSGGVVLKLGSVSH